MPGPLEGIRVIDLTAMVSGPLATMILADQGADVIKIENPKGGDHTRLVAGRSNGMSASFLNNNRNKKSVALNLKHERGRDILKKLVAQADVFIQNFRPGVIERMGFGEDALRALAPKLIYVSISGFGETGPYAKKPVYDPLVQALSGLTTIQGGSDEAQPRLVRTILPDKLTGFTAAQAITAALLARERTGTGQHVRLSMLDTVISFLWGSDMTNQTFVGREQSPQRPQSFIDLIYQTRDGYISVAVQSDKEWAGLCRALDKPDWLDDPRFKTAVSRHEHIDERLQLTQDVLATKTSAQWLERLEAADVPSAPVLYRNNMISHPQIEANETLMENVHPHAGPLRQARPAARFSKTPAGYRRGAPLLGEDTAEVLGGLGIAPEEIDRLRADGVIAVAEGGAE
jgi:crotonobetainyl-CoA:carnitine CoA-transferase CaiB-like acyl-CoA transferase